MSLLPCPQCDSESEIFSTGTLECYGWDWQTHIGRIDTQSKFHRWVDNQNPDNNAYTCLPVFCHSGAYSLAQIRSLFHLTLVYFVTHIE